MIRKKAEDSSRIRREMKTGASPLIESRRARRYGSSRHNTVGRRRLNMEGMAGGVAFDFCGTCATTQPGLEITGEHDVSLDVYEAVY